MTNKFYVGRLPTDIVSTLDTAELQAARSYGVVGYDPVHWGAVYGAGQTNEQKTLNVKAFYLAALASATNTNFDTNKYRWAKVFISGYLEVNSCLAPIIFTEADLDADKYLGVNVDENNDEYNAGTAYVPGDIVWYGTFANQLSLFICLQNTTGNAPTSNGTDNAYWANIRLRHCPFVLEGTSGLASQITNTDGIAFRNVMVNEIAGGSDSFNLADGYRLESESGRAQTSNCVVTVRDLTFRSTSGAHPAVFLLGGDSQKYCRFEGVSTVSSDPNTAGLYLKDVYRFSGYNITSSMNMGCGILLDSSNNCTFQEVSTIGNKNYNIKMSGLSNAFYGVHMENSDVENFYVDGNFNVIEGYQEQSFARFSNSSYLTRESGTDTSITYGDTTGGSYEWSPTTNYSRLNVDSTGGNIVITMKTPASDDNIYFINHSDANSTTLTIAAPPSGTFDGEVDATIEIPEGETYMVEDADPSDCCSNPFARAAMSTPGYWAAPVTDYNNALRGYVASPRTCRTLVSGRNYPGDDTNYGSIADTLWWVDSMKPKSWDARLTMYDIMLAVNADTNWNSLSYGNGSATAGNNAAPATGKARINLSGPSDTYPKGRVEWVIPSGWLQIENADHDLKLAPLYSLKSIDGVNYWTESGVDYQPYRELRWLTGDTVVFDFTLLWDQTAVNLCKSLVNPYRPTTKTRGTNASGMFCEIVMAGMGTDNVWVETEQTIVMSSAWSRVTYIRGTVIPTIDHDSASSSSFPFLRIEPQGIARNHDPFKIRLLDMNVYKLHTRDIPDT